MIITALFKADDLLEIIKDPYLQHFGPFIGRPLAEMLARQEYAFTVFKDMKPIACIGLTRHWEGRYEAWAFVIPSGKMSFVYIHKQVKRFLRECPARRIEANVRFDFEEGHRWVELLGFKLERENMEGFGHDGSSYSAYALVRGEE